MGYDGLEQSCSMSSHLCIKALLLYMFLMYWNTKNFNCGPVVHYCIYSGQSSNYYYAPLPGPGRDQGQLVYVV